MSRRLLQIFSGLNALIAVYNGGSYVVLGIAAVPLVAGARLAGIRGAAIRPR